MKKLFTLSLLICVVFSYQVTAQSVRTVLAEEFTQASCPPCASQNPTFNTLLNANPTKVIAIKYQTSWPGVDPMNAQTQSWVGPRVTYYGVNGVPTGCMDGQEQRGGSYCGAPANWTQSKINTRQAITSPYDLTVTHTLNATMDSMHITVNITATAADSGDLVLHVAMIERDVPFCHEPGTNGEIAFEGVMRKMVPNSSGTTLSSNWNIGQTQTFDFDVAIPDYIYDKNTLAVVTFIQDNKVAATTTISAANLNSATITVGSTAGITVGMYVNGLGLSSGRVITAISGTTLTLSSSTSTSTQVSGNGTFTLKDVRQAAYSVPQQLTNDAKIECDGISNVPLISCGNAISPSILFKNLGSVPLTSLNLDYKIDNVAQTAIPWTGNVASGATGTINIPSSGMNTSIGNHTLKATVTNPNGTTDNNVYYDASTISYIVTPSVGTGSTISQSFASSAFPPANWNIYNADGGIEWERDNASTSGTGSAFIDFYSSPDGAIDEMYLPSFDYSNPNITNVTLDFDQAYCQYTSTTNDSLVVLYSTNCGQSWTSVYNKGGASLAHGNAVSTSAFSPTASQWHHETVSLNGVVGQNNVYLKFKGISAYGNNAYVDNINLNTSVTGVNDFYTDREVMIYPNPSQGRFNVQMNFDKSQDVTITVANALGSEVKTIKLQQVVSDLVPVDLTGTAKGTYSVTVQSASKVFTKRITITQ